MKISAVSIRNYKRIREVVIKPDADAHWVLIGGDNAQGKSSVLDAIEAALGGKAAIVRDPVHHGADQAEIRIEFAGGALTVRRLIDAVDGMSTLEVRDDLGTVKSPQAMLDKLIGKRFLDPQEFLSLPATAPTGKPSQRATLLDLIDSDGKIAELDARNERVFSRRTEVSGDHRKAAAELERIPAVDPAASIDVAQLSAELRDLSDTLTKLLDARHRRDNAARAHALSVTGVDRAKQNLEMAQRALTRAVEQEELAQVEIRRCDAAVAAIPTVADAEKRRDDIQAEIARASEHNRVVAELAAGEKRRLVVADEVTKLAAEVRKLTAEIDEIKATKASVLEAAKLPIPGLSVDATGIMYQGAPLANASSSERLRIAIALAVAARPTIRDVWIRDGALFDDAALASIVEMAKETSVRVWIERVGRRLDPGTIIIHDGVVFETGEPAQPTAQTSLFR